MGKTDIIICLRKRNKGEKNIKKIMARQKSLNTIINRIIFLVVLLIVYAVI